MTAPDDLARTLAEHREVKPWVCLCGWWSAIQEPDGSDYARHLASVVSRRDADLRTRIEAALNERVTPTLGFAEWAADPLPSCPNYAHVNPEWLLELIAEAVAVRKALDADTHEAGCNCVSCQLSNPIIRDGQRPDAPTRESSLRPQAIDARSRRPADTDTGRGQ